MSSPATSDRRRLVEAGLLIPSGMDGICGWSGAFEDVVAGLTSSIVRTSAEPVERRTFPPVMPTPALERTGYVHSFPHLIGSVDSFLGGERGHLELLEMVENGGDWAATLTPSGVALCSAVCHPLYPTCPSPLPPGGQRYGLLGYVFRHEPSEDPARLQSFRQYEYVYVGEPENAVEHRDLWLDRAEALLESLGIEARRVIAHDPFFGRAGRLLTANQEAGKQKIELLAATGTDGTRAVASGNIHLDHFAEAFGIVDSAGAVAHSACIGFGLERITLALLHVHGLDPAAWPEVIRCQLDL